MSEVKNVKLLTDVARPNRLPELLKWLKKKRVHYFTIFASPTPTPQPPKKTKRPTGLDGLLSNVVLFKGRILNRCLALVFNVCLRFCLPDLLQSHYISIDDHRTCERISTAWGYWGVKFGGDLSKGACYDKDVSSGMVHGGCGFFSRWVNTTNVLMKISRPHTSHGTKIKLMKKNI